MEGMGIMAKNIQLLDCTLRDGGYINDWEFGQNKILNVYRRLIDSKVDIIEVGFIDERRPFDINRTIFPDVESIKKTLSLSDSKPKMLVGMIDYGTCSIDNICDCSESILDGIRVIFKKHLMKEALDFVKQVKAKGYKVFAQLVAVSDYTDEDVTNVATIINEVEPYAMSMVDTYGLLYPDRVLSIYKQLDELLKPEITIGFHAHNNLQLAYANSISFLNFDTNRNTIVDGTLYGMGKSAGNTPIELLVPYVNENCSGAYLTEPLLECIEESIKDIFASSPWGYRTQFYLSSEHNCHPNYVSFLMGQDNISISDISVILSRIDTTNSRNLLYDRNYIQKLYDEYISESVDDDSNANKLRTALANRNLLIVGPGKNLVLQKDKVLKFIEEKNPIIISINFMPKDFDTDYIFVTKKSRYQEMTKYILSRNITKKVGLIVTSNVDVREDADFIFDRAPLLERREEILDNSFLMLLKVLKLSGIKEISCAGLDGYTDREDNYYDKGMEYSFVKSQADRLNHHIREVLENEHSDMNINFVTYSHYMEVEG